MPDDLNAVVARVERVLDADGRDRALLLRDGDDEIRSADLRLLLTALREAREDGARGALTKLASLTWAQYRESGGVQSFDEKVLTFRDREYPARAEAPDA